MSARVLVVGTGAIGSVYAYVLSKQIPSSNIVCVCRSNYQAIKDSGITVNSSLFGDNLKVQPAVVHDVSEATTLSQHPFDYIIVTAKAFATSPSLAEQIQPAVSPSTTIVLIQNGIAIEEPYSTLYPSNPLLSTVVYLPATQTTPGTISHAEIELLHVGTYPSGAPPNHKTAAKSFVDLLTSCSATAKLHDDVQLERWSKLLVNASWNPTCALTRSRDAEFLHTSSLNVDEMTDYMRDVMKEIARVARACGYASIDDDRVEFQIGRATKRELPGVEPSMLADARGGRRMEVDAIVGNTLKIAREKGVQTPLLRATYVLLSGLDGSFARARQEEGRG